MIKTNAIAAPWVPQHSWKPTWEIDPRILDDMRRRLDRWLRLRMLGLMPMLGPRQSGSWQQTFSASMSGFGAQSFNTENFRMQVKGSDFTVTGGSLLRFTLYSHASNVLTLEAMTAYECSSGWTSTNPDFAATPTAVAAASLGSLPWTLTAGGGPWVTDSVGFGITAGIVSNGLGIAFKFNNGSNRQVVAGTGGTGLTASYKTTSNETGTADVSSYVASTDGYKQVVCGKVEVFK
jgi:hypothetical protein